MAHLLEEAVILRRVHKDCVANARVTIHHCHADPIVTDRRQGLKAGDAHSHQETRTENIENRNLQSSLVIAPSRQTR